MNQTVLVASYVALIQFPSSWDLSLPAHVPVTSPSHVVCYCVVICECAIVWSYETG